MRHQSFFKLTTALVSLKRKSSSPLPDFAPVIRFLPGNLKNIVTIRNLLVNGDLREHLLAIDANDGA